MASASQKQVARAANGQFRPGVSGNLSVHRSRHALNSETIREMHLAFRRGGRKAIDHVMKQQPAVFLKLLVLLVPREMKVEHSNAIKDLTDEPLEAMIEYLKASLEAKAQGTNVIGGEVLDAAALPAPEAAQAQVTRSCHERPTPRAARKARSRRWSNSDETHQALADERRDEHATRGSGRGPRAACARGRSRGRARLGRWR